MTADFPKMVDDRLAGLTAEDAKLAEEELKITVRRAELRNEIGKLTRALEVYRELVGLPAPPDPEPEIARSYEVFRGTLADHAVSILTHNGGRMRMMDLIRELQLIGKIKTGQTGPSEYGTVYRALSRDKRVAKAGKGEWAIAAPATEPVQRA